MMNSTCPFDLVIGLDRSDRKADLYLIHTASGKTERQTIRTSPEALHDWLLHLRQKHPNARVAICLEQPAVSLILFFEAYLWITLYAINPITLQKFREAFVTSRAKDDGKDAQYLGELLFTHHAKLKPWQPDDAQTRRLQQLVSHRRTVIDDRTALSNCLKALLKHYFPQALDLCGEDLWRLPWPPPSSSNGPPSKACRRPNPKPSKPSTTSMARAARNSSPSAWSKSQKPSSSPMRPPSWKATPCACNSSAANFSSCTKPSPSSMRKSPKLSKPTKIMTSSPVSPVPARSSPHAYWPAWDPSANASPAPATCNALAASPPSPNRAEPPVTSTVVIAARSSANRAFMSTPRNPSSSAAGPPPFTSNSARKAAAITPPSAPWPTNGSASSGNAGRPERPTMKNATK